MSTILAIDLGKFKSVTCLLKTETNETEFWTIATDRHYLETVLKNYAPDLVVIEACPIAGWIHDVCTSRGYQVLVCNPAQEPWKLKHLKRKTDRDDALKIAKLAALNQLVPVYIPGREQREFRSLVKYRKVVLGRRNRVQNHIRAIFDQRGMSMTRGLKAWTQGRREELTRHSRPLADCTADELWRGELELELAELARLSEQLAQIDKKLSALGTQDERVRLLRTIPGVGPRTAEVVVAYLDNLSDLRTPGRSHPTPAWSLDGFNQARWTVKAASTNVGRGCCAARWSRRPGSCSALIPGRGRCTSVSARVRRRAGKRRSWLSPANCWCVVG
ncbi:MAG: transposase [Pirellulales bacterium]